VSDKKLCLLFFFVVFFVNRVFAMDPRAYSNSPIEHAVQEILDMRPLKIKVNKNTDSIDDLLGRLKDKPVPLQVDFVSSVDDERSILCFLENKEGLRCFIQCLKSCDDWDSFYKKIDLVEQENKKRIKQESGLIEIPRGKRGWSVVKTCCMCFGVVYCLFFVFVGTGVILVLLSL